MNKFLFSIAASIPLALGYVSGLNSLSDWLPDISSETSPPSRSSGILPRQVNDVTSQIQHLGNPFTGMYPDGDSVYARNPWDLHLFSEKIFIGAGNSSNKGPASNAGPVPILSYDLRSGEFSQEGEVDDEQIDVFRVLMKELYIPGHDPTQSWKFGNYYRRNNDGSWAKNRNIPNGLHTYDLAWHKGSLFAALGTKNGGAILKSDDKGISWTLISEENHRVYTFLRVDDVLYGASKFAPENWLKKVTHHIISEVQTLAQSLLSDAGPVSRAVRLAVEALYLIMKIEPAISEISENGQATPRLDIGTSDVFPDTRLAAKKYAKIIRPLPANEKAFYIGAYIHNDHQYMPFGLYAASSLHSHRIRTARIPLPEDSIPWDILVANDVLYILLSKETPDSGSMVQVLKAPITDTSSLEEFFRFNYASFARSFELADGNFYFGIGGEVKNPKMYHASEISPFTGEILKIEVQTDSTHEAR